jgi:hypothetical protein
VIQIQINQSQLGGYWEKNHHRFGLPIEKVAFAYVSNRHKDRFGQMRRSRLLLAFLALIDREGLANLRINVPKFTLSIEKSPLLMSEDQKFSGLYPKKEFLRDFIFNSKNFIPKREFSSSKIRLIQ